MVEVMYQRCWQTTNNPRFANKAIFPADGFLEVSKEVKREACKKAADTKRDKYDGDIYSPEGRQKVTDAVRKAHKERAGTWVHSEGTKVQMSESSQDYWDSNASTEHREIIAKGQSERKTDHTIRHYYHQESGTSVFGKVKRVGANSKKLFNCGRTTTFTMTNDLEYTTQSGWKCLGNV